MDTLRLKFVIIFLLSTSICGFGQWYSISSIPYSPDPFDMGAEIILPDDGYSQKIAIGFPFCFYGGSYDTLIISSNSYLSFQKDSASRFSPFYIQEAIHTANDPVNSIMFPWQDLEAYLFGGTIKYSRYGIAPNRRFVVSFDSTIYFDCNDSARFSGEVVLFETSNAIETFIKEKPLICSNASIGYAIHGIQNVNGNLSDVVPGRNYPSIWTASNEGMKFSPNFNPCIGLKVEEVDQNDLFIKTYPNPAKEKVKIEIGASGDKCVLTIYNLFGAVVFEFPMQSLLSEIDLSPFPPGVYFIRVSNTVSGFFRTDKLIIE